VSFLRLSVFPLYESTLPRTLTRLCAKIDVPLPPSLAARKRHSSESPNLPLRRSNDHRHYDSPSSPPPSSPGSFSTSTLSPSPPSSPLQVGSKRKRSDALEEAPARSTTPPPAAPTSPITTPVRLRHFNAGLSNPARFFRQITVRQVQPKAAAPSSSATTSTSTSTSSGGTAAISTATTKPPPPLQHR